MAPRPVPPCGPRALRIADRARRLPWQRGFQGRTLTQGEHAVSKFDLRDISDRLTASRSTEAVVFEFLGYLQSQRGDWKASLAFYEVSRDSLVAVYERHASRLVRKDLSVPVDRLPPRLVR